MIIVVLLVKFEFIVMYWLNNVIKNSVILGLSREISSFFLVDCYMLIDLFDFNLVVILFFECKVF